MRICGLILLGLGLTAVSIAIVVIGKGARSPVASMRFRSCADGGTSALFEITNHTRDEIHCGGLTFDFKDSSGWRPYHYTLTQSVAAPLPVILGKNAKCEVRALLPATQGLWRASIACTPMTSEAPNMKSRLLLPILRRLGLENSETGTVAVAVLPLH